MNPMVSPDLNSWLIGSICFSSVSCVPSRKRTRIHSALPRHYLPRIQAATYHTTAVVLHNSVIIDKPSFALQIF